MSLWPGRPVPNPWHGLSLPRNSPRLSALGAETQFRSCHCSDQAPSRPLLLPTPPPAPGSLTTRSKSQSLHCEAFRNGPCSLHVPTPNPAPLAPSILTTLGCSSAPFCPRAFAHALPSAWNVPPRWPCDSHAVEAFPQVPLLRDPPPLPSVLRPGPCLTFPRLFDTTQHVFLICPDCCHSLPSTAAQGTQRRRNTRLGRGSMCSRD